MRARGSARPDLPSRTPLASLPRGGAATETVSWDPHFATGLEQGDQQHRNLFAMIDGLGSLLNAGSIHGSDSLQTAFEQFLDYVRFHFTEEERLAAHVGVVLRHQELHRKHHQEFVEQVFALWRLRDSMTDPGETLHGFLRSWLAVHILGEDQPMVRQIILIRAGESPERASQIEEARADKATAALLESMHGLFRLLAARSRGLAPPNLHHEKRVAERNGVFAVSNAAPAALNPPVELAPDSDGLLSIPTRRLFDTRLPEEWRRSIRERRPLALLMIDVDYFERYNDTYGRPAGDACLQFVARAVQTAVNRAGDLPARYGGGELALILPNTDLEGALVLAQAIRQTLADLHIPHAGSAVADEVTLSIGVATIPGDTRTSVAGLLGAAERGLQAAREHGRNRISAGSS